MKKIRFTAFLTAAVLLAGSLVPVQVSASSITDLQQQAESMFNDALSRAVESGGTDNNDNSDSSSSSSTDGSGNANENSEADIQENAQTQYETVEINSREDFDAVVKNCHTDTWSSDKKIVLNTDLDFDEEEFEPVRSFGGIFDGNGHSLTGVKISEAASDTGVFGTIRRSASVLNLKVQGEISPSGTQGRLGGIAGLNYGTIENCSFDGTVRADRRAGGIVGFNGQYGTVKNCTTSGTLAGRASSGGVVGYNAGTITGCRNSMKVNITYRDTTPTVDELTTLLDNALQSGDLLNTENFEVNGDSGGIAGFSSGVITSCTNYAVVGYEHVGYNVGGIVGRSSGFLQNNTNYGEVFGRKDTGGIAGQLQPYLSLDFAEDVLNELDDQLDDLDTLVSDSLDQVEGYTTDTLNHLKNISSLAGTARDAAQNITDETADAVNDAEDKIDNAVDSVQNALDTASNKVSELENFLQNLQNAQNDLSSSLDSYLDSLNPSAEDREKLKSYWDELQSATDEFASGLQDLKSVIDDMRNTQALDLSRLRDIFSRIRNAHDRIRAAIGNLVDTARPYAGGTGGSGNSDGRQAALDLYLNVQKAKAIIVGEEFQKIRDSIVDIRANVSVPGIQEKVLALRNLVESVQNGLNTVLAVARTADEIRSILSGAGVPEQSISAVINAWNHYKDAWEAVTRANIAEAWSDVTTAVNTMDDALSREASAVQELLSSLDSVSDWLDNATDTGDVRTAFDNLEDVLNNYPGLSDSLSSALDDLASLDLQTNGVSDSLRNNNNSLYQALTGIESELDGMNTDLTDGTDQTENNLQAITSQVNDIIRTMKEAVDDLSNTGQNRSIEDVSEEDIQDVVQGRMTACVNYGEVQADTNVGGVAGMMGVGFDLDPDTDIKTTGNTSLDYIFRMKCIVDSCTNNGVVEARGSYSGGVVGQMEMGLVSEARNFGNLDSESNYVGGVAGYATGNVRNSSSKCDLSGKKYIGGIAGFGVNLHDNYAMVNAVDTEQYVGAVAGKIQDVNKSDVYDNYYYSESIYGIDGVSYQGIAEGLSYEDLVKKYLEKIGGDDTDAFTRLVLTFRTDDEIIKTLHVDYGGSVPEDQIPDPPEKEGFYGEWSRTDYGRIVADETITVKYSRIDTLLSSEETRDSGLAMVEVAGNFSQNDKIVLTKLDPAGGETERWKVEIPDDGQSSHQIRYLTPDESTDAEIYLIQDGKKKKAKTTDIGKYIVFDAEGSEVTFAAKENAQEERTLLTTAIIAAAAAAVLLLLIRRIRKKRKQRKQEAPGGEKRPKSPKKIRKMKHRKDREDKPVQKDNQAEEKPEGRETKS